AALRAALTIDPHHRLVHRALALLYLTTKRAADAEPHFKALAGRPEGALALADYYTAIRRPDAALAVLAPLRRNSDKSLARAAQLRAAAIDYDAGRTAEAYREVDALIGGRADNEAARLLKARWLIADGDPLQAGRYAADVLKTNQQSAPAQYTAGLAAFASGNLQEAESAFRQVVAINPRAAAAELQLARVHLAQGDPSGALKASERAANLQPDDGAAAVWLARSLRANGDLSRARTELSTRLAKQPHSAALNVEMGWVALDRQEIPAARKAFETALRAEPRLYDAQAGLVAADIASGSVAHARTLVDGWLRESPTSAPLHVLLAK